jgi:hypothetical protein
VEHFPFPPLVSGPSSGIGPDILPVDGIFFTPNGTVFLGAAIGQQWCPGYTFFNADQNGSFSNEVCQLTNFVSSPCGCGQSYLVVAYDYGTARYATFWFDSVCGR